MEEVMRRACFEAEVIVNFGKLLFKMVESQPNSGVRGQSSMQLTHSGFQGFSVPMGPFL
jgi:hypothetical protein